MWELLFYGLIEVWILNLKFELHLGVCDIVMKFWEIMAHINEIGDVWGVSMGTGKLEVEETGGGRTQIQI